MSQRNVWISLGLLLAACGDDATGADASVADGSVRDASPAADAPSIPDALPPIDGYVAQCTPAAGTSLTTELVAEGLAQPIFVTSPPGDARLFIVEKCGQIRILDNGTLREQPFLDIGPGSDNPRVRCTAGEQGLLGLAFHPDYAANGRFFVNYTGPVDGEVSTVVAEYRVSADPNVAETDEKPLFDVFQPDTNHNGGMIAFGPDGYLYTGMGDGGGQEDPDDNGEDPRTLLGAMLRIDVDGGDPYAIPASNPYAASPDGEMDPRREIWAIGFRNPWRFSFDRDTGDLYIADVGQRDWEEVNIEPAGSPGGANYGWNEMEGSHCFEPSTGCNTEGKEVPVVEYGHVDGNCSITGGYVYRGSCMPDIDGWYFYADYCTARVWALQYRDGALQDDQELDVDFGSGIVSFGEDAAGEMYVVNIQAGTVRRIVIE